MNGVLQVDQPDLLNYIMSVLSLDDEKQRILRFRKLLERAKKEKSEKGVPNQFLHVVLIANVLHGTRANGTQNQRTAPFPRRTHPDIS